MGRYAQSTNVSVERSESELKATLLRYGADNIMTGTSMAQQVAFVACTLNERSLKIVLPLPNPNDEEFTHTVGGNKHRTWTRKRSGEAAHNAWEQGCRARWRVLVLMVKSKLEYVSLMPDAFDQVFLSDFVLPRSNGRTIGEEMVAQLDKLDSVPLLPMGKKQ